MVKKITQGMTSLSEWVNQKVDWFDRKAHGWLKLLTRAFQSAMMPDSVITAAAIAYFAVFSLFPFTLLVVAIGSFGIGGLIDHQVIVQRLEFVAPALGQLLGANIDEIIRTRGPVTLVAIISLAWSASTFFFVLTATMNKVWSIEKLHPVWRRRGTAILLVLVLIVPSIFLASFADNLITTLLSGLPAQSKVLIGWGGLVLAILLDITLFMVLYVILPHSTAHWRDVIPGAIASGLSWEFAKKVFLFFIADYISFSNLIYGSVAAVIALLTWAYLSGLIFLFGAYLNAGYYRLKLKKSQAAPVESVSVVL